jgi:TatD DNase family protein
LTDIDPKIIDTHSHLHGKDFEADLAELVTRAREAGIAKIALIGVDSDDTDRALEVARQNAGLFFVVAGLHPHEASKWNPQTRDRLVEQVATDRDPGEEAGGLIRAIGEMGLDYHYDFAPRDAQRDAFIGQMEIARDADLPIVIHCREAYDDCLEILRDFYGTGAPPDDPPRGVLHCYFGTLEQAQQAVELGFMLGVGGSCTFKKAEEVHRVVAEMPLNSLVMETDAPYMAPVPFRGKRNESSYLTYVAARIGELKNLEPREVVKATTANAKRLYRF